MPLPARRRALIGLLGALALALWYGPGAAADDAPPPEDRVVDEQPATPKDPADDGTEDDGEVDEGCDEKGGADEVPAGSATRWYHAPQNPPGHGHGGNHGGDAPDQTGDGGTAGCDDDEESPATPPAGEPEPEPEPEPAPAPAPEEPGGGTAPSPSPTTPSPSSAGATGPADATPSSLTGTAAPPPASAASDSETAPVASPPTPDPSPAGGGDSFESAAVPLLDGNPVDLQANDSDGDDLGPLLWILVPLALLAGSAVGATAWALRPIISRDSPRPRRQEAE